MNVVHAIVSKVFDQIAEQIHARFKREGRQGSAVGSGASVVNVDVCAVGFIRDEEFQPRDSGSVMWHVGPLKFGKEVAYVV